MSGYLLAGIILVAIAALTIGAAKGFTIGKTLRVAWWGLSHPVKAFISTYDREHEDGTR